MPTPNKAAPKKASAPAVVLGKKSAKLATPPAAAKAAPVAAKKPTPAPAKKVAPAPVAAKPPKVVKPAAVKPVIKAAVEPQPPKRSALELSMARVKKAADSAIVVESAPVESSTKVPAAKEVNTHLPEAMVRKPPPVAKKPVTASGKISFSDLVESSKAAQGQMPASSFDVLRHLKRS